MPTLNSDSRLTFFASHEPLTITLARLLPVHQGERLRVVEHARFAHGWRAQDAARTFSLDKDEGFRGDIWLVLTGDDATGFKIQTAWQYGERVERCDFIAEEAE